ncbi:Imm1 family immunity protein [Streptomyces galilaeus]
MILSAFFHGAWHYGETEDEKLRIVAEAMDNLASEGSVGGAYSPGEDAWFSIARERHCDENRTADNHLRFAINKETGYGSLIWCVNDNSPRRGGIYDSVWISNNPEPPSFDPRVVSDPGYPLFHDPSSALLVAQVRAAVEEFCRVDTGDRPECIDWVPGDLNGQRLDRPSMIETVEDPVIDWGTLM